MCARPLSACQTDLGLEVKYSSLELLHIYLCQLETKINENVEE